MTAPNDPASDRKVGTRLEVLLAFAFGVVFCSLLGYLVVRGTPISDPALVFVLRVLTSLSAAAVAAVVPGFLDLHLNTGAMIGIRAGGALAVFALVFSVNPPDLLQNEEVRLEAAMLANKAAELYDDADRSADKLLRINPKSGAAHNVKGSVAFYRGDFRAATAHFDLAVAQSPKPAWVSNLAYAYIEVGAYQKAIDLLLSIRDGKPDWYFSIGRAYLYAGDFPRARDELATVPTSFWHGAGRILEAAALAGMARSADATQREAVDSEVRERLTEGVRQDPEYWEGILSGKTTDIHLGYSVPRNLLADFVPVSAH